MIYVTDLPGVDEDLARELIAVARTIAPCLDTLEQEEREIAVSVLRRVARDAPAPGQRRVRSRSRNGTSVTYADHGDLFDESARVALRSLCGVTERSGLPMGSFPTARPLSRLWPEGDYS